MEGKRRQFQIEKMYLRKDGSLIWVSNNVSLVPGTEGVPRFIMALSEDITERKRGEEALQRSESYLREAQALSHMGSWAWRLPGKELVHLSAEWYRVYGFDPNLGMPTLEERLQRIHPEDRDKWREARAEAIRDKSDYEVEFRILLPDGTIKWVHTVGHPELAASGELVQFVGTSMDVTEQHEARAALQRSEDYLAEAQKLTRTGSWAVQVPQMENASGEAGQEIAGIPRLGWSPSYWSKEMYRIFGFDPGPTLPSYVELVRRFHPEDVHFNTSVVEQALRDRTDFEIDYRLLLPDSAVKYIHVVGHPVVNASDDVIELVGTSMDVTEQHEARAALQAAFEQIKAEETELRRMTDAVASYIYVLRPDGSGPLRKSDSARLHRSHFGGRAERRPARTDLPPRGCGKASRRASRGARAR